ncbi:diguanylate cyclase (GGDEF) domain-containing protein [Kosakonia oryziphila]|uniref:diguanylate cyclase n=1 Tax=Kosakonia oryziphila TaxID=1005667 RepID=A0A1C4CLX6_9ENTR|nr:diguanylate cyclase (GGDEF) domain-containing protein [Kosakonia oryziphila]
MLLDIDYFKSVNDSYGHECGDQVLASFARQIKQVLGDRGVVARMGGEEFVVVATTRDPQEGVQLAEMLRLSVANHSFQWRQQTLHLTVSIGISSGKTNAWQLTEMFNSLLAIADENLYRSKKQGRNRTTQNEVAEKPSATSLRDN